MKQLLAFCLLLTPAPVLAQPATANRLEDRRLGLRFGVPDGWVGRQSNNVFVLGSHTVTGLILVIPHAWTSVDALKREAAQGWVDASDQVYMPVAGVVRQTGPNAVSAELAGKIQGERARAYAIGLMSPHGGGAVIVAATSEEKYSPLYARLAGQVAASMEFFRSEVPKEGDFWTRRLRGRCVAYLKSSYSTGPSYGGYSTGSGWSEKRYLYLFENGRFQAMGSFSGSFDSGGGFGSVNSGPERQSGTWRVVDQLGESNLILVHAGGGNESFTLTRQGEQTYLNGRRWFVVSHQECN